MNGNLESKSGFCRFMPVSKQLELEPVIVEGVVWPSQAYYEKVARLHDYVGTKLYVFTGLGLNPQNETLERIMRLDEKMLYTDETEILFPHALLLDRGNIVNLARVTHISTRWGITGPISEAVRAIFEGGNVRMQGSMLNSSDPSIIYRNEENIEAALQMLKRISKAAEESIAADSD